MGDMTIAYKVLVGNLKERDHLKDLNVYGSIILKYILKAQEMKAWTGFI
jgi:hypothetical protein